MLKISEGDLGGIRDAFKDATFAREHMLVMCGMNYHCVRADESAIYAKEVRLDFTAAY